MFILVHARLALIPVFLLRPVFHPTKSYDLSCRQCIFNALKNLSGSFLYNFSYTVILKKKFFHPGILALGRLRQENGFEFKVSLGFIESSGIALVAKHDPASENQKKDDMTLKTNL